MTSPARIALVSLRAGLHWPRPVSCIQDAFFTALRQWFRARGEQPAFWNVSWSDERPQRDGAAIAFAQWVFLFSSNEFLFHSGFDTLSRLMVQGSNDRVERIKPLLRGKRVVLFTMDAQDTGPLIRDVTLAGSGIASFDVISECDFPLTIQSLRYNQLRPAVMPGEKARPLDFAYWGTTKRFRPGGEKSGDARFDILRDVMARPILNVELAGNHFGKAKAGQKFDTCLANLAPKLMRARATCCFQWPGHGHLLTARYHEALAFGLIPFVHADYDSQRQIARADWQRIGSAKDLFKRLVENRDPGRYADRLAELTESYLALRPADALQVDILSRRLDKIMGAA